MPVDPVTGAALISAAGKLLDTLLKTIVRRGDAPPDEKATKVMNKAYDQIRGQVTTNSLRVLIVLWRADTNLTADQIRGPAQEMVEKQEPDGKPFEEDLRYRLLTLSKLGLITPIGDGGEYYLNALGYAFIQRAMAGGYHAAFT